MHLYIFGSCGWLGAYLGNAISRWSIASPVSSFVPIGGSKEGREGYSRAGGARYGDMHLVAGLIDGVQSVVAKVVLLSIWTKT